MNIYVDFDDCLCETARHFSGLVKEMFNLDIPYEQIHYFNLQKSFDLTDQQYDEMMIKAHQPEILYPMTKLREQVKLSTAGSQKATTYKS